MTRDGRPYHSAVSQNDTFLESFCRLQMSGGFFSQKEMLHGRHDERAGAE